MDETPAKPAATGVAALAAGTGIRPAAAADVTIRQGYQTNIWGMPTYYLMKSGYLEKRGIKTEDFAVPSGNLTMQQMVARQVDMGTYAGPSFILGHDKGGLIAIAQIETVGATGVDGGAKGPRHHQARGPQGQEDRQPDRLLDRQHLRRSGRSGERPEEGRLPGSPHGRQQHDRRHGGEDRGRHDQRRALQRHRRGGGARHDHHEPRQIRQGAGVHGGDARFRREAPGHDRRLPQGLARRQKETSRKTRRRCRR